MGLIKFGGGVAAISGKISGTVFARNRSGAYARNWSKPTNPGSILQSGVRALLGNAATAWQMLTVVQVDAWNAYAATLTRLNRLGDSYVPTGRQIYVETFVNLSTAGLPTLVLPGPTGVAPGLHDFAIITAEASPPGFSTLEIGAAGIALPSGDTVAHSKVLVYAAPCHSTQKVNLNKQRRFLTLATGDQIVGGPKDITDAYNTYFGNIADAGLMVDLWARVIDPLTGLTSGFSYVTSIIS